MHPNWGCQKFVSSHLIESAVCILFFSYLRWKQNNQSSCREHPIDLNFLFSHNIEIPGQHHRLAGPSRLASTTCDGTPRTPNNSVRCSIEKGARRSGKEPCRRQPRFQSGQKRSFFDMLITRLVHVLLCALMSFLPCMWCKKMFTGWEGGVSFLLIWWYASLSRPFFSTLAKLKHREQKCKINYEERWIFITNLDPIRDPDLDPTWVRCVCPVLPIRG